MNNQPTKSISFGDSALLITVITASLFTIGYLHEAPFLERFGLRNEEFIPNSTMLITCGFKYIFVKLIRYTLITSVAILCFAMIFLTFSNEILGWIRKQLKIDKIIEAKKFLIYCFISTIPFLAIITSLRVVRDGHKSYEHYLNLNDNFDILLTKCNPNPISGKVIRYNNNKVAFFDIKTKTAIVVPDSEIVEIRYSVPQNTGK